MPDPRPDVGDVVALPLSDGAWGACQVTGVADDSPVVVALAWHSAAPPTLKDLVGVGPLMSDHQNWDRAPEHVVIIRHDPVPPDSVSLGRLPVPGELAGTPTVSTGWGSLSLQIVLQHWWDHELADAVRTAYRAAATRGPVEVDFGAGAVTMGGATASVDFRRDLPAVPATGEIRWAAFDQLPRCTALTWAGPDRGLVAALEERPIISSLVWHDPPAELDLRATSLRWLALRGYVSDLRLPRSLNLLSISAQEGATRVTVPDHGRWLDLAIETTRPHVDVPAGLDEVRNLTVTAIGTISAAPLARLTQLRTLWLRWRGAPGTLEDAEQLRDLRHLTVLRLSEAYGMDADTLPDLPALRHLDIYGLRRSVAKALRARYRDIRLVMHGAKSDTWLAANLDNPFRNWVDDDERAGRAACKAYADAVKAIDRLAPSGDEEAVRPILQALVEQLNKVEQRYGIIDTLRREEAGDAFADLASRAGLSAEIADPWFEDWRDF